MTAEPALSVIMSVHNAGDDLHESIPSILNQTFEDFEFIIIDDGSTDSSFEIIQHYAKTDLRLVILRQTIRTGLTIALNQAITHARGRYLARQDADDVSYPDRLKKQFQIMERNPDILVCGSACDNLFPSGFKTQWNGYSDDDLKNIVFIKTPFAHSTAMIRADAFRAAGGYDPSFRTAQDMELWMRLARRGRITMIQDSLLLRRIGHRSISHTRRWRQTYDAFRARQKHNKNGFFIALYHTLRNLIVGLLPEKIIALKHRISP